MACMMEEIKTAQIRTNQNYARRLSLPDDHTLIRAKSVSRSPNRYDHTLRRVSEVSESVLQVDQTDGDNRPRPSTSPEVAPTEDRSFLNPAFSHGKPVKEIRDVSPERRSFFGSSFYRSLRVKREDVNSSASFQRGNHRAMSMRQKISSMVKSPTNFIKNATQKNSPASSKSNVSLSPSILRSNAGLVRQSRILSYRNSLPETSMISTIPEDGFQFDSESPHYRIHHYKHFDSLEEKSISNTMIIRRSSLTGQLEHCYKGSGKVSGEGECNTDRRNSEGAISLKSERSSVSDSISTHSSISAPRSPDKRSPKMNQSVVILSGTVTTV